MSELQLLKEIVNNNKLMKAPTRTTRHGDWFEILLAIGKDDCAHLTLDAEALKSLNKLLNDEDSKPSTLLDYRAIKIDNICNDSSVYPILQDIDSTLTYIYNTLLDMRITNMNSPEINSMLAQLKKNREGFSKDHKRID